MFKIKKKGDPIGTLVDIVIGLVVIGIVIVISLLVMSNTRSQIASQEGVYNNNGSCIASNIMCSAAWNSTLTTQLAIGGIPGWLPLIVLVSVGIILLGLIMFFRQRA